MNKTLPSIEFAESREIAELQNRLLRETLSYVAKNSPYYKRLFAQHNIDVTQIKNVEQLAHLPICSKSDLQQFNSDFLCVAPNQIVDYITTSGTLGDPVTFALSDSDLERLAYNEAISFACAGCDHNDIFQLMTTIDKRFMAGLAYFLGVRKLGAGIIRVGNGAPQLQWDTIERIKPTVIICVPSFILKIIDYAEKNNIDYRGSSVAKAICIGESIRDEDFSFNELGRQIKQKWDIELYSTYASTEMSTTFTECSAGRGGHHHPELIIAEIVDQCGLPAPHGEYGELVVTTLGVEAMPLVRFNTGDIARFETAKCSCGRTTKRISPIRGRTNQMIKYKGTTLYPPAIFDVLERVSAVVGYYIVVSTSAIGTDEIDVHIAVDPAANFDVVAQLRESFRAKLRVTPRVTIQTKEQVFKVHNMENNRKPIKFIDERK